MHLCLDKNALNLPVALNRVIWCDQYCADLLIVNRPTKQSKSDASIVDGFIKSIPVWMRYANVDKIRKDALSLLGHREILA